MRYELADCEWDAIKPMLPNKPRGIPRVNDRRVLMFGRGRSTDQPCILKRFERCLNQRRSERAACSDTAGPLPHLRATG
jgi:hypothetical protein